ncbi:MAG: hypothetical protein H6636_00345 [Anaerolineales bacterium]|nr:hypothetical protein [Anaerolineales bacterium]
MIRPFDWRDFPTLHRHRERGLCLDMALELTRSMTLVPVGALLSYVAPATGIYTYVAAEDGAHNKVIGQFSHAQGSANAQLTFIAPSTSMSASHTLALLDHLAQQAGKHGASNLLAEVNERSIAFEILRKAGYAIYARQRIWRVTKPASPSPETAHWRPATEQDTTALRQLYNAVVPALVQQIEPAPWEQLTGMVCYQEDELLGYVHLNSGPQGTLAQPIFHPNIEHVSEHLNELIYRLSTRRTFPLYFVVRSHQAWLDLFLTEMGAEAGSYQAVMVKRLAILQKASLQTTLPLRLPNPGLETAKPEIPVVPFTSPLHLHAQTPLEEG